MKLGKTNIISNQIIYTNSSAIILSNTVIICTRPGVEQTCYHHLCAVPELECQSRETPTCYNQSATGSRNSGIRTNAARFLLRTDHPGVTWHAWALFPPAQSQCAMTKWRRLGHKLIRVELYFTRIFNQHNYNAHIYNIYI